MGRAPCCDKGNVKKGPWSPEEDEKLCQYIEKHGTGGNWISLPQKAGLRRCGKSCRLRWLNYLRPNIKHGEFSEEEDRIICSLYGSIGSRWSVIAAQLPGRTDNDIKNYWNTKLKKKIMIGLLSNSSQKWPFQHQANTYPSLPLFQASSIISPSSSPQISSPTSSPHSPPSSALSSSTVSAFKSINNASNHEAIFIPVSFSSTSSTVLQSQDSILGPMQNHQVNYESNRISLLSYGGEAASCSSSDGSCITNLQISHVREAEHDVQNYIYNGVDDDHKFILRNASTDDKPNENEIYGENSLDYSLEEIKQLISTNICSNLNFSD